MRPLTVKYLASRSGQKKFKTWINVVKHFFPDVGDAYADHLLWNSTCFPFSDEMTLDQLYSLWKFRRS